MSFVLIFFAKNGYIYGKMLAAYWQLLSATSSNHSAIKCSHLCEYFKYPKDNQMKSPLAYFGNRGNQKKDIFKLVQDFSQRQRGKQYDCCYDFFSGSGSMSLWAMENDLAKRYVINDVFFPLAAFWQEVKNNPEKLIQEYSSFLMQYDENDKLAFYSNLQSDFNQDAFITKHQYAAAFAFIINHAEHGVPLLTLRNGKQFLECRLTQELGKLKIDEEFAESVKQIHDVFKNKNIEFKSDSFCDVKVQEISGDDLVILDPPYPDMDDAEEKPEQHIYPRSEPKAKLQEQLNHCLNELDRKGAVFFMFYGVLGMKNNHPVVWPKGHVLHLSGEPSSPFGEYIEHLYLSSSLANYFVDHLPRYQGNIQPLFYRIFETHALEEPEQFKNGKRNALAWEENGEIQHLTYAALNKSANQLAHYLLKMGLKERLEKGEEPLVGIYLDRSPALIIAILAVMKTGASYLPLETNQTRLDINASAERLQQSGVCFLLTHTDLDEKLREQLSFKNYPNMHVVSIDRADSTCEQLKTHLQLNNSEFESNPAREVKPESLAYVMYTSGSSGTPKGVEVLQRGLPFAFESHQDLLNLGQNDRVAQFASVGFDASLMEIMMGLGTGAELYLINDEAYQNRHLLIRFLQDNKITVAIQTPNMLANLPHNQFPSLRSLLIVGDKFEKTLSDKWIVDLEAKQGHEKRQIVNGYGLTETTICTSLELCAEDKPLTIGAPILGLEVFLRQLGPDYVSQQDEEKVDVQSLEQSRWLTAIDQNQEGELYITGPCLARGYWQRKDLTAVMFFNHVMIGGKDVHQLYRTKDQGRFTASGMLEITGRIGRQIKISGQRIELGEVENWLKEMKETVKDVRTVTHLSSNSANKILVSFIERYPIRTLSDGETLETILRHLKVKPYYMHPALIKFLDQLPRKGDKLGYDDQALSSRLKPKVELEEKDQPALSQKPIYKWLSEIYAKYLGVEEGILEDFDFVTLGGDSLLVTRCLNYIKQNASQQPLYEIYLNQLTLSDLYNLSIPDLIQKLKQKQEEDRNEEDKYTQEIKSSYERSQLDAHTLILINEKISSQNKYIYGKTSLPFYCVPSLLGDAALDYGGSVLQQIKAGYTSLTIPQEIFVSARQQMKEETKAAIFMEALVACFIQQIKNHNPNGPYWLLGWSSGGHIALKIAEKLRKANDRVFVYLLDAGHPKLMRDMSLQQHAHALIEIGLKIEEGIQYYLERLIASLKLPTKESLMVHPNKIIQAKQFFDMLLFNLREKRLSLVYNHQLVNDEKFKAAEKLILSAKMIYLSEITIQEDECSTLSLDDALFIADSNTKELKENNLGFQIEGKANITVVADANHFSLLHKVSLIEMINNLLCSQLLMINTSFYNGIECVLRGESQKAIVYFSQAIKENPKSPRAYRERGTAKLRLALYKEAKNDFDDAIKLDPKEWESYANRGMATAELGDFLGSIKDFDEAIKLNPEASGPYANRGITKIAMSRYQEAITDLNRAIKLIGATPESAIFYQYRARAKAELKLYKEAEKDANEAIKLDPKYALSYVIRGIARSHFGRHSEAMQDFNQAIILDPKEAFSYTQRGIAYFDLGLYEEAIRDLTTSIELDPNYAFIYAKRGEAKARLGRHQEAIEDFDQAIRLAPKLANLYEHRGRAKAQLKLFNEAIADCNKAIELDPTHPVAYATRATVKAQCRQFREAIVDYDQAIKLDPKCAVSYENRGSAKVELAFDIVGPSESAILQMTLKLFEEAITDFNKAIALDPKNTSLREKKSECEGFIRPIKMMTQSNQSSIQAGFWSNNRQPSNNDNKEIKEKKEPKPRAKR